MNGQQFVRKVRKLGRDGNTPVRFVTRRGKGSHGTLYHGTRFTTVKAGEIGKSLFHKMCKDLGIDPRDL